MVCKNTSGRRDGRKALMLLRKKNAEKHQRFEKKNPNKCGLCCCERRSSQIHSAGCPLGPRISSSCGQAQRKEFRVHCDYVPCERYYIID